MKKKLLIIISLFILFFSSRQSIGMTSFSLPFGDNFKLRERKYKSSFMWGDQTLQFNSIITLESDRYIVGGRQRSNKGVVIKLNQQLNKVWEINFDSVIKNISFFNNNHFIVNTPHSITQINNRGNKIWTKKFSATINSLQVINKKDIFVAGSYGQMAWVAKLDSKGKKRWEKKFKVTGQGYFNDIEITEDNNLILAGEITTKDWNISSKSWVIKVDKLGIEQWERKFFRANGWSNRFLAAQETKTKKIILVGTDGQIVKLNHRGELIWKLSTPGFTVNYNDIVETSLGDYIIVGTQALGRTYGGGAVDYPYLLRVDNKGNKLTEKRFEDAMEGSFQSILANNNNFIVVGAAFGQSRLYNTRGYLVELTSDFWQ